MSLIRNGACIITCVCVNIFTNLLYIHVYTYSRARVCMYICVYVCVCVCVSCAVHYSCNTGPQMTASTFGELAALIENTTASDIVVDGNVTFPSEGMRVEVNRTLVIRGLDPVSVLRAHPYVLIFVLLLLSSASLGRVLATIARLVFAIQLAQQCVWCTLRALMPLYNVPRDWTRMVFNA